MAAESEEDFFVYGKKGSAQSLWARWVTAENSRDWAHAAAVREAVPGEFAAAVKVDGAIVAAEHLGDAGEVLAQGGLGVVRQSEGRQVGPAHKQTVGGGGGYQLVAFGSTEADEGCKAGSLLDGRVCGLDEFDADRDGGVELDADDLGRIVFESGPDVVIVTIDVDRQEVEILGQGGGGEEGVEAVRSSPTDKGVDRGDARIASRAAGKVGVAGGVALDQDGAVTSGLNEVPGVAQVDTIPSAELDAPAVTRAEGGEDFFDDPVLAELRVFVTGVI